MSKFVFPRLSLSVPSLVLAVAAILLPAVSSTASSKPPAAASPQPSLTLWDDTSPLSQLIVGDDLRVSVAFAQANSLVKVALLDGNGLSINRINLMTDSQGKTAKSTLWFRSGIKGCDQPSWDPSSYVFRDHAQAEQELGDSTFTVLLYNESGRVVSEVDLPIKVGDKARYFFSDATGCPRSSFLNDQDVFLSGYRAKPGNEDTAIFLVDRRNPLSRGGDMLEVRPIYQVYPQTFRPSVANGAWTGLLWPAGRTMPGIFGFFVRIGGDQTSYELTPDDLSVGIDLLPDDNRNPHGISIKNWGNPPDEDED